MNLCSGIPDYPPRERAALEEDGEIETDSESDDPSAYIKSTLNEKQIAKVTAIKRQVRRKRQRTLHQQHFLGRENLNVLTDNTQRSRRARSITAN